MSIVRSSVHAKWIVGKVIGTAMQKTAKVRVTRLVLDPYLLKVRDVPSSGGIDKTPPCSEQRKVPISTDRPTICCKPDTGLICGCNKLN